ncbi:DUF4245 domain-containing protein [Leucobacter sp. M11]|uniref:DUF4245 domain-containing protein n=1 Tax=Leucobacter sp. M11 TaxID=2993565 RepID=UPI002D7F6468|nr:DUF4245 domain-containing protein [Leucobacter sp. M11]MEB4615783.1 DUF4245 domain-containing protein [Leucobacter sp. M11]
MAKKKRVAIVAELGRPETPEETAARKAQDTKNYRERKTVNNLVFSLLVTVAMVAVIFLAVPRGNLDVSKVTHDVPALAAEAETGVGRPLVAPDLDADWRATWARVQTTGKNGVVSWSAGYETPSKNFASFQQAWDANPTWVAQNLENQSATGVETIAGVEWTVYDHRDKDKGKTNVSYGLEAVVDEGTELETTFVVSGTDSPEQIKLLATRVLESYTALPEGE